MILWLSVSILNFLFFCNLDLIVIFGTELDYS